MPHILYLSKNDSPNCPKYSLNILIFDFLNFSVKVPPGCTTELSHKGQQFLSHLFERHDKDRDGALSPRELEELFSTCPVVPWGPDVNAAVVTNERGWITYQGYICQWALMALTELPRTLECLAYLGYNIYENESQVTALQVTREKKLDLAKKQSSRNVYMCHVIGASGSGKSSLCRTFVRSGIDVRFLKFLLMEISHFLSFLCEKLENCNKIFDKKIITIMLIILFVT